MGCLGTIKVFGRRFKSFLVMTDASSINFSNVLCECSQNFITLLLLTCYQCKFVQQKKGTLGVKSVIKRHYDVQYLYKLVEKVNASMFVYASYRGHCTKNEIKVLVN